MSSTEPIHEKLKTDEILGAYRKWFKCQKRYAEHRMFQTKLDASSGATGDDSDDEEPVKTTAVDPDTGVPGPSVLLSDAQLKKLVKAVTATHNSKIIAGVDDVLSVGDMEDPEVDTDAYNEDILMELDRHYNTMMRPVMEHFMCTDSLEWECAWWKMTDFSYEYLLAQWKKLGYKPADIKILEARWLAQTYVRARSFSPCMTDSAATSMYNNLVGVKEGLNWVSCPYLCRDCDCLSDDIRWDIVGRDCHGTSACEYRHT